MKLELKHLAAYLPYNLQLKHNYEVSHSKRDTPLTPWMPILEPEMLGCFKEKRTDKFDYKPILRPLSDIFKFKYKPRYGKNKYLISEIIPNEYVEILECGNAKDIPNDWFQLLVEYHFDVFYLIDKGLAVDSNSL